MGVLWGVLWAPGAVLGKPWGAPRASAGAPGRSLGVPGRSWATPWATLWETKCAKRYACAGLRVFSVGVLGASWWALGVSLGVLGGSLGGAWGSWSCSWEAFGGRWGVLGASWGVFGRSLGVPGGSLATPWATLWGTKCAKRYAQRGFSVSCFSLIFFRMLELSCGFLIFLLFFKILRFSDLSKGHQTLRPCRFPRFLLFAYSLMPIFTFS